jgi:hypothetical protein
MDALPEKVACCTRDKPRSVCLDHLFISASAEITHGILEDN